MFRRLWALHHEIQLCLCNTWYLLFCVDDCLVYRVEHLFYRAYRTVCLCNTWYLLFCVDDFLVCRVEHLFYPAYRTVCLCNTWQYLLFCVDDWYARWNICSTLHTVQCVYATLGTCYSVWMTVWYAGWNICSTLHTRQSSTQNNKYQVSHKHSFISWWWAHSRPKHVEIDRCKYTKKNCAPSWFYVRDYTEMHRSTKHKIYHTLILHCTT